MSDKPSSFKKLLKATKPSKSKSSSSESKKAPKLKDQSLITEIENLTKDKIFRADDNDVSQLRDLLLDTRKKLNPYSVKVDDCDDGRLIFSFINKFINCNLIEFYVVFNHHLFFY